MKISFRVYGVPKPGGSKNAFYIPKLKRSIIVDACKKNKEWRNDVRDHFRVHTDGTKFLTGPLKLVVRFIMPRLKAHYNSKGLLKDKAPLAHTTRPDATKLLRSTEDALTGLAWYDDAQVCLQTVEKVYGDKPGAEITIEPISDAELCPF